MEKSLDGLETVFEKCDKNIISEKERKEVENGTKTDKKKDNKMSYQDKRLQSQCNNISNEEINRWRRMKTRKARVDELKMLEGSKVSETIDNEIESSKKKKSWKTMDMCFKWILIESYLELIKIDTVITDEDKNEIKKLIQKKVLNVDYDKNSQSIKSLNFTTMNGNII